MSLSIGAQGLVETHFNQLPIAEAFIREAKDHNIPRSSRASSRRARRAVSFIIIKIIKPEFSPEVPLAKVAPLFLSIYRGYFKRGKMQKSAYQL